MIEVPKWWMPELEQSMSIFGDAYYGYCIQHEGVIFVGFVSVKQEYRGEGYFKALLSDLLKESRHAVVLYSPSFPTRRLAEKYGYIYDESQNVMVWMKDWPCYNHRCDECEGNMCAIDKHWNDCPYRIDEYIEFVEVD